MDFDGNGPDVRYVFRHGAWQSDGNPLARKQRYRGKKTVMRRRNIAVLDLETDPFDNTTGEAIYPFLAVVYSDQFPTITIWDNDHEKLLAKLATELEALDEPFIIYAHNGGRFDYMFLMHLLDGRTKFKGRALMSAKLGKHELRDSLHIIPESLKNANRKIDFDYTRMKKSVRDRYRPDIERYCLEDCIATFEVVKAFVEKFGLPMTIGQASMTELKKHYTFSRLSEPVDRYMRQWFFGGRVECFQSPGHYRGDYKLYDVNSMYPSVMAFQKHPTGDVFYVNDRVTPRTAFIHLKCHSTGAFLARQDNGDLWAPTGQGEFFTTVHEYDAAKSLGLVRDVRIIKTIDFVEWQDFRDFVLPLYTRRDDIKKIRTLQPEHPDSKSLDQELKFIKYLLNNAYGKFAQNPRKFKDYFLTPPGERPPDTWLFNGAEIQAQRERLELDHVKRLRSLPEEETTSYWIWGVPSLEWRFNNVATAASITGAARAKLLRALHSAVDRLYCDTDSLVCRELGYGGEIDASKLGAWKCETEITEFIMAGKKLYGYKTPEGREVIRAKGQNGVTWSDLQAIVGGAVIRKTMNAPTLTRAGTQHYMVRELRMTGKPLQIGAD